MSGRYVPALAFRILTPIYDPILRLMFDEATLKGRLVEQADVREGQRVLDLGCGTGTLLALLTRAQPRCRAYGIDGDPAMLAAARRKLGPDAAGLVAALAERLPFAPESCDRVLSSLFFHHLSSASKLAVLRQAYHLLRPGGELHVLDFGRPASLPMLAIFSVLRLFDGLDNTRDNVKGLLPRRMEEAGFSSVAEVGSANTIAGTVTYYRALRP